MDKSEDELAGLLRGSKANIREALTRMERDGSLPDWVKENHPDCLLPCGDVGKFSLATKLDIW